MTPTFFHKSFVMKRVETGFSRYAAGWNWRAIFATLLGCTAAWTGLFVPSLRPLSDYGWFVGFGVAAMTHLLLMKVFRPRGIINPPPAAA
jgi:NCS1 family nucleobase:cation symporter-1